MGTTVTTAGRIYKGQKNGRSGEEETLVWEKFTNMAQLKVEIVLSIFKYVYRRKDADGLN